MADAYIDDEYALWKPAVKAIWLLNPSSLDALVWECSECKHLENGPWYDLPLQCPMCERAMMFYSNNWIKRYFRRNKG